MNPIFDFIVPDLLIDLDEIVYFSSVARWLPKKFCIFIGFKGAKKDHVVNFKTYRDLRAVHLALRKEWAERKRYLDQRLDREAYNNEQ